MKIPNAKIDSTTTLYKFVEFLEKVNREWDNDKTLLDWFEKRSRAVNVKTKDFKYFLLPKPIVDPSIFLDLFFTLFFRNDIASSPN